MSRHEQDEWSEDGHAAVGADAEPPSDLRLPRVRSAEDLVAAQQARLGVERSSALPSFATDADDDTLPVAVQSRLAASAAARLGALVEAGASREALGKILVEIAQDEHREELAAFECTLMRHARAEARYEAGRWSTPRALEERAGRLHEGLRNTPEVRRHKLALERRGQELERAWQLLAVEQRFAEARGRATRMYRHNFVRADGMVEALRSTAHYWVEMRDGRRVGALRHRREGGYRFEPATRMDRHLTAALRERFEWERFYDPDTDAITISNFVHAFESTERAAGTRAAREDYASSLDAMRPLTRSGPPSLGFVMKAREDAEVGGGLSPESSDS